MINKSIQLTSEELNKLKKKTSVVKKSTKKKAIKKPKSNLAAFDMSAIPSQQQLLDLIHKQPTKASKKPAKKPVKTKANAMEAETMVQAPQAKIEVVEAIIAKPVKKTRPNHPIHAGCPDCAREAAKYEVNRVETVKWSWASPVQSKSTYRDDEFIRSQTREDALSAIDFLMNKPRGLTYTITVLRGGEYFTYWRHSMPCLGGLVKYRDSHGEKHYMNPYFPRDIYVAFPEGEIVFISCMRSPGAKLDTPYYEFMFSQESPWVSAFGSKDTIIFKNSYFILTNMNTDPTVFYSLMRLGGLAGGHSSQYKNWNPKAEVLALKTSQADPRRLAGRKPLRISGGTWAEGFGYTRPYNESIFKTTVPTKFKDFGKLAGYPQAEYNNSYFIAEMKKKFGVNLSGGIPNNEKTEKVLVEAWDYFKERATELSEQPGN